MPANATPTAKTIGYLIAFEDSNLGFVGGLLVVNENARPLEFHCSVPFRPTQAQRVLYGATLSMHLLHEQIPELLMSKVKSKLDVILVDDVNALESRSRLGVPVGSIQQVESNPDVDDSNDEDRMVIGSAVFHQSHGIQFAVNHDFSNDHRLIENALARIADHVEIDEPMERLRIAIEETCKTSSNAA